MLNNSKSAESNNMCSNFLVPKSCFITATEIIPPANPATKYDNISGIPCITYFNKPIDITWKYCADFSNPTRLE